MTHSLLRSLIRETLLQESDSPTARAASAGYAVVVHSPAGDDSRVIIYSPEFLFDALEDAKDLDKNFRWVVRDSLYERCIVRSTVAYREPLPEEGPCWGGSVIVNSVAAQDGVGYLPSVGPAAYEAAMWYSSDHRLAPDRDNVSSSAERVWSRYRGRAGSGVEALDFDDIESPQTPDPDDDCRLHGREALDHAYSLAAKPAGLDALERNHAGCVERLERDHGVDEGTLTSALASLSVRLFGEIYDG
jgi:hypothetical protein